MTTTWLLATLSVLAMGFAIQRGGTCMVAAVDEMLSQHRAHRLAAMLEASLWVAGGLALARLLHLAGSMPAGFAVDGWTLAGGVLLGLGAWVNRACVFGAIARLGSGQWAYAATPLGFYLGCLSVSTFQARPVPRLVAADSPLLAAASVLGPLFVAYALWRVGPSLLTLRRRSGWLHLQQRVWAPHAATIVIGVSFTLTLLAAGRWAYTDVLADLALGSQVAQLGLPLLLLLALFGGALIGGWSAGRWRSTQLSPGGLTRCLAGGVLMGWGSLLIPGSNDGLILIGLPLLQPHAWLALTSMTAAIGLALTLQRRWVRRADDGGPGVSGR